MTHPVKYADPQTGLTIHQLTNLPCPARKTYFSNESWGPDNLWIYFMVAGGGSVPPGIYRHRPLAYATLGSSLMRMELGSMCAPTVLGQLPRGARPTAHYTAGKNGLICNSYKLAEGPHAIIITDPHSGRHQIVYKSDTPLGHCQICPGDDETIFFVHETGGDALQRMWMLRLGEAEPQPFFVERPTDWITHETWDTTGEYLTFIKWPEAIMVGAKSGRSFRQVATGEFHHCAPSPNGKWIAADCTNTGEILLIRTANGETAVIATGQRAQRGEDHCHPSFNRAGDKVCFTSPRTEPCQIAYVDLNELTWFTL